MMLLRSLKGIIVIRKPPNKDFLLLPKTVSRQSPEKMLIVRVSEGPGTLGRLANVIVVINKPKKLQQISFN